MMDTRELHHREYGSSPDTLASAPGSIALLGEHGESAGGSVLTAAVQERMRVAIGARSDMSLRFYSVGFSERKKTSISTLKWRREDRWANNSKGVIAGFLTRGVHVPGLEITIDGDVPSRVGMGSSTAICVATAFALNELLQAGLAAGELIRIAVEAETEFQGYRSSTAAAAAAVYSRRDNVLLWQPDQGVHRLIPFQQDHVRLLWVDPQVPITGDEIDLLHQRQEETQGCVDLLSDQPAVDGLGQLRDEQISEGLGSMPEDVRRGCKHLRDDESRVAEAILAIEQHDSQRLGKCLYRSHESLRDLYEISNPEIDWLVRRRDSVPGVLGGRRTGIGARASIVLLIEDSALDEYREQLTEYERIFGFTPQWRLLDIGPGAGVEQN